MYLNRKTRALTQRTLYALHARAVNRSILGGITTPRWNLGGRFAAVGVSSLPPDFFKEIKAKKIS